MKIKLFVILILVILGSLVIGDNGEFDYSELHSYLYDITLLAPTDSKFIVGDGTDWVAESGNTARTSLGLGSGDSPAFTNLFTTGTLVIASDAPATITDTGTAGTITWDSDYMYVCVATDSWKRSALSTWGVADDTMIYEDSNTMIFEDGNTMVYD